MKKYDPASFRRTLLRALRTAAAVLPAPCVDLIHKSGTRLKDEELRLWWQVWLEGAAKRTVRWAAGPATALDAEKLADELYREAVCRLEWCPLTLKAFRLGLLMPGVVKRAVRAAIDRAIAAATIEKMAEETASSGRSEISNGSLTPEVAL